MGMTMQLVVKGPVKRSVKGYLKMKNLFLSIALAMSATVAQAAPGYLYDCDMTYVKQGKGWVSPKIAFVLPGDGTVKVVDAVTLHFNKEPLRGTIARENDKRLVITWVINNARTDSGTTFNNLRYRASISKSSGQIELTARPGHYDSGLRSPGSCRKRTQ